MTKQQLITGLLILLLASNLRSQTDSVSKNTPEKILIDSNAILKEQISSVNQDIYETADKLDSKIGKLRDYAKMAMIYSNRIRFNAASVQPPKLPINIPQPIIDTIPTVKESKGIFHIFRRRN